MISLYKYIFIFLNRSQEVVVVLRISDFRGDWKILIENIQNSIKNEIEGLERREKLEKNDLVIICLRVWLL